jgi:hypothetical protein
MTLVEQLIEALPELSDMAAFKNDLIIIQDDSDGTGAYIAKWEYSKPVPKELASYLR